MARKNKYVYLWVIQGYFSDYGWEDVSTYDKKEISWKQVKDDLKEYRYKSEYAYRVINRRELNN